MNKRLRDGVAGGNVPEPELSAFSPGRKLFPIGREGNTPRSRRLPQRRVVKPAGGEFVNLHGRVGAHGQEASAVSGEADERVGVWRTLDELPSPLLLNSTPPCLDHDDLSTQA